MVDNEVEKTVSTDNLFDKLAKASDEIKSIYDPSEITVKRGRLLKQIKNEISKIKANENLSDKDNEVLNKLEEMLSSETRSHKNQLAYRYKSEFSEKSATIPAVFTVLPKGVGIQAKRVANCIEELRQAKTNKEKIFGFIDVIKQTGVLAATPVVFTVKFVVKHWYLLLLFALYKWIEKLMDYFEDKDFEFKPFFWLKDKEEDLSNNNGIKEPVPEKNPGLNIGVKPIPIPGVLEEPEESLGTDTNHVPVPNVGTEPAFTPITEIDEGLSTEVIPEIPNVVEPTLTEPVSDVVSEVVPESSYYDLLRQLLPDYYNTYSVYNTYEDAIESLIKDVGYTRDEAINYLHGGFGYTPSILWLVGEGGFYANNFAELMQNYTVTELEQMVAENQSTIEQMVNESLNYSSLAEYIGTLSGSSLALFIAYELLQYGLAYPTGGASLLLPG